jgi:hypothetical protein
MPFIACFLFLDLNKALFMNQLSKLINALLGLLLAPFYPLEERERDKKLRERLARLERKDAERAKIMREVGLSES